MCPCNAGVDVVQLVERLTLRFGEKGPGRKLLPWLVLSRMLAAEVRRLREVNAGLAQDLAREQGRGPK